MKLSITEQKILADLYDEVINEMDSGDVLGNFTSHGGEIENKDNYAPGDTRKPKLLGGIQTRKGLIKKKKRKWSP